MQVGRSSTVRLLVAVATLGLTQLVVACGGGGGGGDITKPTPVVTQLALTTASSTIVAGQQATITAQPKDADGNAVNGLVVSWSSSDQSVATVSQGVVSALKPGQVTITATAGSVSNTTTFTVVPAVATVNVSPSTSTLGINGTQQLTATLLDASGATIAQSATRVVTWSSSNDAVASVSSAGLVTARTLGSVTITASIEGKSGSATVDVKAPAVASVSVSGTTVRVGESTQLQFTLTDVNGQPATGRVVSWTTSDASKVSVSSTGVVKGEGVGSATITATSEGKSGSAQVTVVAAGAPIITSLTVAPASVDVRSGAQTVTISGQASAGGSSSLRSVQVTAKGHTISTSHADPTASCTTTTFSATGAWSCTITIPRGAASGSWPVVSVVVTDNASGSTTYTETPPSAVFGAKFTVTSDEDVTTPVLTEITVTPTNINVASSDQQVSVSARYTDDLSGVASFIYRATSVNNPSQYVECTGTLTSGTATDGWWSCTATIPKGAEPGSWTQTFTAVDAAFNKSQRTPAALLTVTR